MACRSTTEARAPGGAPEYKPGVSPRTPGKACIAGQALNERQTSCGQRPSAGGLRLFRSRLAAWTYQGRDLQRGATKGSQTVPVLNELRRSRGKGSQVTFLGAGMTENITGPVDAWCQTALWAKRCPQMVRASLSRPARLS